MKYLLAIILIAFASPLYANPVFEKYVQWIVDLQDINGDYESQQAKDCVQSLEPVAYKLHAKWMDQVDHPAEKPNDLFVFMLEMSCRDHHGAGGG